MSNQLTDFEAYIYHRNDTDPAFDLDNEDKGVFLFGVMDSMQESFKEEYDELTDNCCNALDISDVVKAIHNRCPVMQLLENERIVAEQIKLFIENALEEAIYKLEGKKEEVDGSYQAKQHAEIQRMG